MTLTTWTVLVCGLLLGLLVTATASYVIADRRAQRAERELFDVRRQRDQADAQRRDALNNAGTICIAYAHQLRKHAALVAPTDAALAANLRVTAATYEIDGDKMRHEARL